MGFHTQPSKVTSWCRDIQVPGLLIKAETSRARQGHTGCIGEGHLVVRAPLEEEPLASSL